MALWIVATLVAYFVKGICGFANSLIFDTILSFGVNNVNISPIDLLVNYPSNIVMIVKNRKSLDWKIYLPLIALVLAGSLPGALLLKNIDAGKIKLVFGFVVVLLGAEMFLRQYSHKKLKSSKIALAIVGVIAGALCGLLGIGALLAAYVGRVTDDQRAFKANMNAVFLRRKYVSRGALFDSRADYNRNAQTRGAAFAGFADCTGSWYEAQLEDR